MNSVNSLLLILSNDNALAECKTVSLDDSRVGVLLFEVSNSLVRLGENLVESCRNVVFFHKFL